MNLVNRAMTTLFDVILAPFELLGTELALILVSGLTGIFCLILFKYISWQGGIKGVKDKIKGHIIAIRIYQDDLVVVIKSAAKVFGRTFAYLGLNVAPIVPLLVPFVLVLSQFVVRYAYDPIPLTPAGEVSSMLSGSGTMVYVELKREHAARAGDLEIEFPEGIETITPVIRSAADGKAFVEIVALEPVVGTITLRLDGEVVGTKELVAGSEPARLMQPRRVSSFWSSWILPAEDTFDAASPLASVEFSYPDRSFAYSLPGGELGVVAIFFIASMLFGVLILKPLNIQI